MPQSSQLLLCFAGEVVRKYEATVKFLVDSRRLVSEHTAFWHECVRYLVNLSSRLNWKQEEISERT